MQVHPAERIEVHLNQAPWIILYLLMDIAIHPVSRRTSIHRRPHDLCCNPTMPASFWMSAHYIWSQTHLVAKSIARCLTEHQSGQPGWMGKLNQFDGSVHFWPLQWLSRCCVDEEHIANETGFGQWSQNLWPVISALSSRINTRYRQRSGGRSLCPPLDCPTSTAVA